MHGPQFRLDPTDPPAEHYGALAGELGNEEVIAVGLAIDTDGDGIPDAFEEDGFNISGGRGVGRHVGVMRDGGPTAVLLLMMLVFGLGIRRYRRN